jgi:hypothetical protein
MKTKSKSSSKGRKPPTRKRPNHRRNGSVDLSGGWKPHLDMYRNLRALQFSSAEHFAAAAELLWSAELRDLPYDLAANRTVIIPQEAVGYFKGLTFTNTEVLSPNDLSSEELAELRREQGPF